VLYFLNDGELRLKCGVGTGTGTKKITWVEGLDITAYSFDTDLPLVAAAGVPDIEIGGTNKTWTWTTGGTFWTTSAW
jgi:hypothetical protein